MRPQNYSIRMKEQEVLEQELSREESERQRLLQIHGKYKVWTGTFCVLALFWFGFKQAVNAAPAFVGELMAAQIVMGTLYHVFGVLFLIMAAVSLVLFFTAEDPKNRRRRILFKNAMKEREQKISEAKKRLEAKKLEVKQAEQEMREMLDADEQPDESVIPVEELFAR